MINKLKITIALMITLIWGQSAFAKEVKEDSFFDQFAPVEINGFLEARVGIRTQKNDPNEKDISVMETRLQVELFTDTKWAEFKYKGDAWLHGVLKDGKYNTREAWFLRAPQNLWI